MENLLKPLKKIGVRPHEIAMMFNLAISFIPILGAEIDKITKAQMSRCADFNSGNLIKRTKKLIPLFIPLFVSTFKRAGELAMAMEARCYRGGDNRTRMNQMELRTKDFWAVSLAVFFLTVIIFQSRGILI